MTGEELSREVERISGIPVPDSNDPADTSRWSVLVFAQLYASFGIAPEAALRLAALNMLEGYRDSRPAHAKATFAEAMGRQVEEADWKEAETVDALLESEYAWAKAIAS